MLVRLPRQDSHRRLHHPVAAGRINKGGVELPACHLLHAISLARQRVDAHKQHFLLSPVLHRRLVGTCRHAVVVRKHHVYLRSVRQERVEHQARTVAPPAGIHRSRHPYVGILAQSVRHTPVAFRRRRRAAQPRHLHHPSLALQARGDVFAHVVTNGIIVGANIRRILVGMYLPVDQYHRNPFAVCLLDNRRKDIRLVGRHHQQVHLVAHQQFDVVYLPLVVIARAAEHHFRLGIKQRLARDFPVHLLAPLVVAALRHADDVPPLLSGASRQQRQ